jgi:Heterokaryon incompatibility protein (HET)
MLSRIMVDETKNFSYLPLSSKTDTIRLLRLLPSKDDNENLWGELFEYDLIEPGKTHLYEALSYVWGSSDKPEHIFVDGKVLAITASLYTALHHLRDRIFPRVLWIDAVCINQGENEDNKEKAQQIQIMPRIYSQANRVLVWLGPAEGMVEGKAEKDGDKALEEIRHSGGKKSLDLSNKWIKTAVLALLGRKWFRRIWVRGTDAPQYS